MTRTDARERRLIRLLCGTVARRHAVRSEMEALCAQADPGRLIALLKRTGLLVLVGGRLLELREVPELARELESVTGQARLWGTGTELVTLEVLDRLSAAGIRALSLKGSRLARELYGDVAARSSIDVDVLVAPADLGRAVTVVSERGWRVDPGARRSSGLPALHETLVHPTLPRVELHWRVHWYERDFAVDALTRAEPSAPGEPLQMQPLDGLIALMLFYARDGFSGLRFPADAAAWWDLRCAGTATPSPVDLVAERYPALTAPVSVASSLLADLVGVPAGRARRSSFRWRVAEGLASPFLDGGGRQAEANAGLADVLLAPPSAAGDAVRRVVHNAPVDSSRPADAPAGGCSASLGHIMRVVRRWALAFAPALVRGYAGHRLAP
jgi:hypothetical protein